jgi:four helix bundle protein
MTEPPVRSYRDLRVWQRAMDLAVTTYELTKAFPREEQFALTSQARRAATSIAANIAEGHGRATRPAYLNFLRIAQGSLKELETHVLISARVGLVRAATTEKLLTEADELGHMLRALIVSLEAPKR